MSTCLKLLTSGRRVAAGAVCAVLLAWSCVSARPGGITQSSSTAPVMLSIVGTNDLHGGILPREGRGGLALLSGYVRNLRAARAADGGAVLLIDAGDMFQGTLESNVTEGASVVAAYNALGYTAAAVGNHEFDFGPVGPAATPAGPDDDARGALKARAAEAKFPFLAANLIDRATGKPVAWPNVKPSVVVEAAGVKVGIIGVMTAEALSATIAMNVKGLEVAPLVPAIAAEASRLRAEGASVVVVTSHAGGRCSSVAQPSDLSSCDPSSEIIAVARALPRGLVDVIVAGHTHATMAHVVEGIAITEAFSGGRAFGRVDVVVDRASRAVIDKRIFRPRDLCEREDPKTGECDMSPVPASSSVPARYEERPATPDAALAGVLAPTLERVRAIKARPVGIHLETPIRRLGTVESPLGNLFTDALRASVPGADVALHNTSGGLRSDLPQGPLIYGSVYEVMPFDNKVVVLRLTGAQLRTVLAAHLQRSRRIVGVSGVHVRARCAGGAMDLTLQRPSGMAIGDDEALAVVASDFLATGGDGILTPVTPAEGFPIPDEAPLARDVLADYLGRRGGRLREDDLVDAKNPRLAHEGALPLTCAQ